MFKDFFCAVDNICIQTYIPIPHPNFLPIPLLPESYTQTTILNPDHDRISPSLPSISLSRYIHTSLPMKKSSTPTKPPRVSYAESTETGNMLPPPPQSPNTLIMCILNNAHSNTTKRFNVHHPPKSAQSSDPATSPVMYTAKEATAPHCPTRSEQPQNCPQ